MVIWSIVLITTRIPVFPCQTFIFDSDQGYYFDICPLVDEDGHVLLQTDTSGFTGIPNNWTWPMLALLVVIFPYLDSVVIDHLITTQQRRRQK